MDETQVEEAMHWCRRSGKWAPGTDRNFHEFVRMLQVRIRGARLRFPQALGPAAPC